MRIDLHLHSDRSDGTLSPRQVVHAGVAAGLDVLALTDHDTATGWAEAAEAADEAGVRFLPGMEISCSYAGRGLHLLAYGADPAYGPLVEQLTRILEARDQRVPAICARLREAGIEIREEDVLARAVGAAAVGRPHIADTLVALGVVASRDEAFARWLSPGRPGDVLRYAAPVETLLPLVTAAGGVSVVAHPWGRHTNPSLQQDGLAQLVALGVSGIEVDHQDHSPQQRRQLRALADELGLVRTGSSDFHGAGKVDHDPGCNTTEPEQLERLLALADVAAGSAGRSAPTFPASVCR